MVLYYNILQMEELEKELNDQENLFVEMYLLHNQKAKAARESGYSEHSDRQTGYAVYNRPHVRAKIDKLLEERTISGAQATKIVSDMAEFDLSDYYIPHNVIRRNKVKKQLPQLIEEEKEFIKKEERFIELKGLTETEFDDANKALRWRYDRIIKWEIELEFNPDAWEIVDGEPQLVNEPILDMGLLIADDSRGKIKKIKYGKDGLEVESYDAKDAAIQLMKVHGKFEKDNAQKVNDTVQTILINGKEISF